MKPIAYYVLLALVLLSLVLNSLILAGLLAARQTAIQALDAGIQTVSDIEGETFETTVHVQQAIPIKADFPFHRTLTVPIDLVIPVSQEIAFRETLVIPVKTVLGQFDLEAPISLTIPISLTVPVKTHVPFTISETLPISTNVTVDLTLPVSIAIGSTPLAAYLEQLHATLQEIRQQLSFGRR
jgi:hypothetical protein